MSLSAEVKKPMRTTYARTIGGPILFTLFILFSISCDPIVHVAYNIVNKADGVVEIRITGLRDVNYGILPVYDTAIQINGEINIFSSSDIGLLTVSSSDTVDIFDSLRVVKNNEIAKPDFRRLETWIHSEKRNRNGGGVQNYTLTITNNDFQ